MRLSRRRFARVFVRTLGCIAALYIFAFSSAQTVRVFAAASLTESFQELAAAFEDTTPGSEVLVNLAGSSTLATQIVQGAPADVFASADSRQMRRVAEDGLLVGEAVTFARNRLVVITPADSEVSTLEDLTRDGLFLVLASSEVPAGNYAREVLVRLNALYGEDYAEQVLANLVSSEPNVRQVAAKVALGEADAAFVYATDAAILEDVRVIEIPAEVNVEARYPLAVIEGRSERGVAEQFVAFVLSEPGQTILRRYGFLSP